MFLFKVVIVFTACLSLSHCKLDRYCSICEDHTMCLYQGIGKDCENVGDSGISDNERKEILDVHNWLRSIVASGNEVRGSGGAQPKAANMRKLQWDGELAKVAQRWADQCRFMHDSCRNDPRWKVGQNIYWKWKYPTHYVNWTEAIFSWYDEVSQYNPEEVNSYRFELATGHYTQMLWHDTYAIGCGRRDYGENKLYVCNYGPAGNWLGEPLYDVGEPCSKCPSKTVCEGYLCASEHLQPRTNTPSETKADDNNDIPVLTETDLTPKNTNETILKSLLPPNENSENVYASEAVKPQTNQTNQTIGSQVLDKQSKNIVNYFEIEILEKTKTNSIEENEIQFDEETKNGIEELKLGIEKLLKSVILKSRRKD